MGLACFTPPTESQAITTLKKRSAIVQHYKNENKMAVYRQSLTKNDQTEHLPGLSPRAAPFATITTTGDTFSNKNAPKIQSPASPVSVSAFASENGSPMN